jgi:AmiR/NasT family two-component response regulator
MPSDESRRVLHLISEASASVSNWPTIWQAEGMIMALFDCDVSHALGRLLDRAVMEDRPLIDVAQAVVDSFDAG